MSKWYFTETQTMVLLHGIVATIYFREIKITSAVGAQQGFKGQENCYLLNLFPPGNKGN